LVLDFVIGFLFFISRISF